MMRIAVVGVGGIGGYFTTRLLNRFNPEEPYEIICIQRGPHLKAIKNRGLIYITQHNKYAVHPTLSTDHAATAGKFDVCLFCVKSYDLEESARMIRQNLKRDSVVISTLNGINIDERLREVLKIKHILAGCIYLSATVVEPGVVRQTGGAGEFFFGSQNGRHDVYVKLEKVFRQARIKAVLSDNISQKIWEKYVFVSSFASLTSFYGQPIGWIIENQESRQRLKGLIQEIRGLAPHYGVILPVDTFASCLRRAELIPYETKTSMQVDVELGRKTELDIFCEFVVKAGKEHSVPTPFHGEVYLELKGKLGLA
jgi:2-dehydropantoate 2-reductase